MGLHRVAASVQPGNLASGGLLRSLGFQREGFSARMLWLPGADGNCGWRDHVSYVVRAEDWPTAPYAAARGPRVVALVNGAPGSRKDAVARQLAGELWVPLFSEEVFTGGSAGALWALLGASPCGGVLAGWWLPKDVQLVVDGLRRIGLDPAVTPEIWCFSSEEQSTGGPLGLGPTLAVDTGEDVGRSDIVRIALQVPIMFQLPLTGSFPASET